MNIMTFVSTAAKGDRVLFSCRWTFKHKEREIWSDFFLILTILLRIYAPFCVPITGRNIVAVKKLSMNISSNVSH